MVAGRRGAAPGPLVASGCFATSVSSKLVLYVPICDFGSEFTFIDCERDVWFPGFNGESLSASL